MTIKQNPTSEIDVRTLLEAWPDLLPDGQIIQHEAVESLLAAKRSDNRYKRAVRNWRNVLMNEKNIFLDGMKAGGLGFRVCDGDDRVRFMGGAIKSIFKKGRKALLVGGTVRSDEIKSPHLRTFQARAMVAAERIVSQHGQTLKELSAALRPPAQLPRGKQGL